MVEQLTKAINHLAPFLAPYPSWVKVLFSLSVITTTALLLSLVLARPTDADSSSTQNPKSLPQVGRKGHETVWLTIERAELYGPLDGGQIQVTASVNGTKFRYPTLEGIEWLSVGPQMASQQFRVPPANSYEVRFSAKVKNGTKAAELVSVTGEQVMALPHKGRYDLYQRQGNTRSANVEATVFYRLSAQP